ncbi:protein FAM163A-like [Ambystoma mexicanum]|uniref:protein FAM163A-like n=1 Tax=Ambystoma mexicanum TaxID=8296 RepID=UPI0037E86E40
MTAGTVVITGGILATVILLSIIAVLCYCRLQYYCCKKDEPEEEEEEDGHPDPPICSRFPCATCAPLSMDGQLEPPAEPNHQLPQSARNICPTCSPYGSPFYIRTADMVRNGGERITYTPTLYKDTRPLLSMGGLQSQPVTRPTLGRKAFASPSAITTEV